MRNILKIVILLFSIKGFSQEVNILNIDGIMKTGYHYKDMNNLLESYEGTWIYTNGGTKLTIVLFKLVDQYNGRYYEDLIVGEYEYKVNNQVVINTLSDVNTIYSNQHAMHKIGGNNLITRSNRPICNDCGPAEKRLITTFQDPVKDSYGTMVVRKINVSGQEAIKVKIRFKGFGSPWVSGQPQPLNDFTVPAGEYILLKS